MSSLPGTLGGIPSAGWEAVLITVQVRDAGGLDQVVSVEPIRRGQTVGVFGQRRQQGLWMDEMWVWGKEDFVTMPERWEGAGFSVQQGWCSGVGGVRVQRPVERGVRVLSGQVSGV